MMKIKDAEMAGVETWQSILQKEFPFMQRDSKDDHNIYKNWGFECSGGGISYSGNAVSLLLHAMQRTVSEWRTSILCPNK